MEREVVVTDFDIKKRGTIKNGLIILVCVICLVNGYFYLQFIGHKRADIHAKMSTVTNTMEHVAYAVAAYNQELNSWPHCDGAIAIQKQLESYLAYTDYRKISSITVTSPTAEEVIITATIKGIDSRVDGKNLTLTGKQSERGILWVWGGTVPSPYLPAYLPPDLQKKYE
jgi:hypothetical protein